MSDKKFDFVAGEVLLLDKPLQWTSFDVVKKVRGAIRIKKVGHAGTLDPLATGLLILCTGKMTKQIDTFQAQEKEYEGTFVLGATTASYDLETEVENVISVDHLTEKQILEAISQLTGDIMQIPPAHSAIKIDGKRVYESARKGKEVKIDPRPVTVHKFELTRVALPEIDFKIICSKRTYIRSLARDLGEILGVGAYMSALRRTRIGNFKIEDAMPVQTLVDQIKAQQA